MVHGTVQGVRGTGHGAWHSRRHSPGHGAVPGAWCGPVHRTEGVAWHGTAWHATACCSASSVHAYILSFPRLYVCLSEPPVCPAEGCLVVTGPGSSFWSRFCSSVFVYVSVGCVGSVPSDAAVKGL